MVLRNHEVALSTTAMCLFFGTNTFLFLLFHLINIAQPKIAKVEKGNKKELSKPFQGTLECFVSLTNEIFRTGIIMMITYICEKHWFFEHATKEYSRDLFMFVLILFFAYALYTIKPVHDLTLLSREQTEEWKGWMQFIFLLYHYFHAEEVYNSVRVMITCYVWMTGFGNFSFFYTKQDFGWLRVVQMLWRLNFSVLLLMWTHGNTYILYYICPLHTFYFAMVYVAMFIFSSVNHTKWLIRWKLLVLGVIIYIIWDVNGGLFDILFSFLGTKPVIGANNGSVWEWYFRTSLDHWSAFLGMIFALNFPISEQFFSKAKGWPLILTAIIMGVLTIWWFFHYYQLPKLEYNLTHSYTAIIPLISYIFFRNITPGIRSGVSMSLHELGKTTLETYLLQHHIWLTSNAKTLLNITPGYPWINFALATALFFFLSKELYRITMSLRGMIMPEDKQTTIRNSLGLIVVLSIVFSLAWFLHFTESHSLLGITIASMAMFLVAVGVIYKAFKQTADNIYFQSMAPKMSLVVLVLLAVLWITDLSLRSREIMISPVLSPSSTTFNISPKCVSFASDGYWKRSPCTANELTSSAYCGTQKWVWSQSSGSCPLQFISSKRASTIFKGRHVVFMGDSIVRGVYHAFNEMIDDTYQENSNSTLKHSDLKHSVISSNISTVFIWSPLVRNLSSHITEFGGGRNIDYLVLGAALWDALYERNINTYNEQLNFLAQSLSKTIKVAWIQPTVVLDTRLNTVEKQTFMLEGTVEKYREALRKSSAMSKVLSVVVESRNASLTRESECVDGVHYGDEVYSVLAQILGNSYALHFPKLFSKPAKKPAASKVTGPMSFPVYGAWLLVLATVMLFSMDAFLGIGAFSLMVFGRSADWEAAYSPLLRKILGSGGGSSNVGVSAATGSGSGSGSGTGGGGILSASRGGDLMEEKKGLLSGISGKEEDEDMEALLMDSLSREKASNQH